MTTISAKVIADSISHEDIRLTTMELRYPRAIHAEFMTHRVFSRNAASSRAIPVSRLIQDVLDDPFVPLHWGKNQKGMQASEEHDAPVRVGQLLGSAVDVCAPCDEAWLLARDNAVKAARAFAEAGYHKQVVNRLLEPFAHINVVVTATDWDNFFQLRDHSDAEPHIQILAQEMKTAMKGSLPKLLLGHEWHLPYVTDEECRDAYHGPSQTPEWNRLKTLSVARCASVSYKTVDGQPMTQERASDIFEKLVKADVFHASPFEHQAQPDKLSANGIGSDDWWHADEHGNFRGWRQLRKQMEKAIAG